MIDSENDRQDDLQLRARVRDAIQAGGKVGAIARKTGIPVSTLNKYVSMRSAPSAINAIKIARAVGLTVEDLAAGKVPNKVELAESPVDLAILERLVGLATSVHEEFGIKLPVAKAAVEAATLYNDLVARVAYLKNPEEVEANLPLLRYHLKKRLEEARAAPGSGKREAS